MLRRPASSRRTRYLPPSLRCAASSLIQTKPPGQRAAWQWNTRRCTRQRPTTATPPLRRTQSAGTVRKKEKKKKDQKKEKKKKKKRRDTNKDDGVNDCPHCKKHDRRKAHPHTPHDKCMWNKRYKGYRFNSVCDELKVIFKPRTKFSSALGGYKDTGLGSDSG